jgi:hypothetical protein
MDNVQNCDSSILCDFLTPQLKQELDIPLSVRMTNMILCGQTTAVTLQENMVYSWQEPMHWANSELEMNSRPE